MSTATMAKQESQSVKINRDFWQKLKFIAAITGEKMSDIANRVMEPGLMKEYKKAKSQYESRDAADEGGDE